MILWRMRSTSRGRPIPPVIAIAFVGIGTIIACVVRLRKEQRPPPNHRDGVVHHTRADAEADKEHFDGKTTE